MKRAISLLLAFIMMLSLCACSGTQSTTQSEAEKKQANYGLYIKDSELFFTNLENDSWQLTTRLVDDESIEDEDLAIQGYMIAYYTTVSADGSLVFFPDKISNSDDGCNLYYRKTSDPASTPTKIDSDVTEYTLDSSASIVTYVKGTGEDRNLYQYSIQEDMKEKIASSVGDYYVSDDGSKILFVTTDGNLYVKLDGTEKEKVASDITQIVYISEDYTTFYYIKDESLYKQTIGADREKIDSEISHIIETYETGELYYLKQESESAAFMDYVVDDMKDADDAAPSEYPSKPRSYNYDTTEEYQQAYAEYEAAYEAYYAKAARDEWREYLEEARLAYNTYTLYFYNGTETTAVTETFTDNFEYMAAAQKPVISYVAFNQESVEKIKLSEITDYDYLNSFYDKITAALFSSSDRYIAVGSTASVLKQEKEATAIRINDIGTEIYYVDDIPDEKVAGDLYKISVVEGVLGEPELYDSDVYAGNAYFLSDTQFLYFKDYKDGNGDLYLNKTNIDYDVNSANLGYNKALDKIYYIIDWDSEKGYGILKEYANGESVKIADDVYGYSYLQDGKVLYLYDYSMKYYAGELYLWENGEAAKVDDDVIFLVPNSLNNMQTKTAIFSLINQIYESAAEATTASW